MALYILRAEVRKLRASALWLPVVLAPALTMALGLLLDRGLPPVRTAQAWITLFHTVAYVYALLFLPLAVCAVAALSCQVEHVAGGWKQLGALPVPRLGIYGAKFAVVMAALATMQVLMIGAVAMDGLIAHATAPVPWGSMFGAGLAGWAACAPLAALQLWVATVWESFGAQFAVSTMLTIPGMIAIGHIDYSRWYPWSQPTLVMFGLGQGNFTVALIAASAVLFTAAGAIHFVRRDVA